MRYSYLHIMRYSYLHIMRYSYLKQQIISQHSYILSQPHYMFRSIIRCIQT